MSNIRKQVALVYISMKKKFCLTEILDMMALSEDTFYLQEDTADSVEVVGTSFMDVISIKSSDGTGKCVNYMV